MEDLHTFLLTEVPPDCLECGACCVDPCPDESGTYVDVTPEDVDRLGNFASRTKSLTLFQDRKAQRAIESAQVDGCTRCVFLKGTIGSRVGCEVYRKRPAACVEFTPGSHACYSARADNLQGKPAQEARELLARYEATG